jgi:hypothetical protein
VERELRSTQVGTLTAHPRASTVISVLAEGVTKITLHSLTHVSIMHFEDHQLLEKRIAGVPAEVRMTRPDLRIE